MDRNQEIDEIDELLLKYFKCKKDIENIVVPQSTQKMAQKVIRKLKFQNNLKKLSKVAVIFITVGIMTTGVVFAKDIVNFITSLFTNSTPAIDTAVENKYVQNVDMEYVYSNDVGVKADCLINDDFNLAISFIYKISNIKSIMLEEYIISTKSNTIYNSKYNSTNNDAVTFIVGNENSLKLDDGTYKESILFNFVGENVKFKNIIIDISKLKIINENDDIEYISGDWKFSIDLNEKMLENKNIEYVVSEQENIEELKAQMNATGFVIELKSTIPIDLNIFDYGENFILEDIAHNKYVPNYIKNSDVDRTTNTENGIFKIYYNNISTYSENIDELILNLNINGEINKIKLTKKC